MMKFEYQYGVNTTKTTVELGCDATLTEALEGFESFLRASGYDFEGYLDIAEDVHNEKEND